MHFTLRQLQVFIAIAQHQNVTRAAEFLNMSQSACSGALKDLESMYGMQLFDRVGKRLHVNELGLMLRPKVEALLARAEELEIELSDQQRVGTLKIGATLTIGNYLAVPLINQYMQSEDGAKVELDVANTKTIVESLLNFDFDIGLIEGEVQHGSIEVLPWEKDELVCFCAPDHPLAKKKSVSEEDLVSARWILREQGSGTRQAFDRAMHGLLPSLDILLELQHAEAIKGAVKSGMGISCLPDISLQEEFERGGLVPIAVPERNFVRDLYIVLHRDKYRSPGMLRWLQLCGVELVSPD
ncbi:MAG: LysR family transcriptional regulator [Cellvibrionaceae bacterium]